MGHEADAEVLGYESGNGIFIGGFKCDLRFHPVLPVDGSCKLAQAGSAVISYDWVGQKIFQQNFFFMLQGVLQRRDDNHLLIDDRDELDLMLIGYVRAEDDVIFFRLQITEHFVSDFLRHGKGDIAGTFRI